MEENRSMTPVSSTARVKMELKRADISGQMLHLNVRHLRYKLLIMYLSNFVFKIQIIKTISVGHKTDLEDSGNLAISRILSFLFKICCLILVTADIKF